MALWSSVLGLWERACFAIKPLNLSDDQRKLESNRVTSASIRSGNVITFTTNDPEKLNLPSVDILWMQWNLTRALVLCGAGEAPEVLYSDYYEVEGKEDVLVRQEEEDEENERVQEEGDFVEFLPCGTTPRESRRAGENRSPKDVQDKVQEASEPGLALRLRTNVQ